MSSVEMTGKATKAKTKVKTETPPNFDQLIKRFAAMSNRARELDEKKFKKAKATAAAERQRLINDLNTDLLELRRRRIFDANDDDRFGLLAAEMKADGLGIGPRVKSRIKKIAEAEKRERRAAEERRKNMSLPVRDDMFAIRNPDGTITMLAEITKGGRRRTRKRKRVTKRRTRKRTRKRTKRRKKRTKKRYNKRKKK
jgi:hypothetical protein